MGTSMRARARERVQQRLVHIEVQHIAELVWLAPSVRLDAGCEVWSIVTAEVRLAERAQDGAKGLVAEEVDCLVGEIELHRLRCGVRETTGSGDRLMSGGYLWRSIDVQVSLRGKTLNEIVEKLRKLFLRVFVAVAAQCLEKLGGELSAFDERVEDRLLECFERAVRSPRCSRPTGRSAGLRRIQTGGGSQRAFRAGTAGRLRQPSPG